MYLVTLKDQLGNQMFAYAAIKCLAKDNGIDFGVVQQGSYYRNSVDLKHGSDLISVFNIPEEEVLPCVPDGYTTVYELPRKQRKGRYWEQIRNMPDNTLFDGHFISSKYLSRSIEEIQSWFSIPDATKKASNAIQKIKEQNMTSICCSVHFRVGKDYRKLGYLLHKSYWIKAAKQIREKYPDCTFVVFYDKKTPEVLEFINQFHAEELHGSLVDDMAGIGACDLHIVCNSTFSIMSALISKDAECVIRPAKYYSGIHQMPDDVFPDEWQKSDCRRNRFSLLSGVLYALYVRLREVRRK